MYDCSYITLLKQESVPLHIQQAKLSILLILELTTFQFVVGDDWFRNLINWRSFAIQKMVFTLTEKYDRIKRYILLSYNTRKMSSEWIVQYVPVVS